MGWAVGKFSEYLDLVIVTLASRHFHSLFLLTMGVFSRRFRLAILYMLTNP